MARNGARHRGAGIAMAVIVASLLWPAMVNAVSVSPVALYIDHRTRTGTLTLHNPGTETEEVEIGFAFGYAQSDEAGQVKVVFSDDPAPEGEPSVVPYLRAFPRQLRLEPGERQVVRVLVTPPADLPTGEYWGRVMVTSRGGQPPIEETRGEISMQINLTTVIAVAVNYRHGDVATGLVLDEAEAIETAESIELVTRLRRTGNAAFIGRLVAEVVGPDGQVLAEHIEDAVVYVPTLWRFSIPKPETAIPDGAVIRYRFEAVRPGTPSGAILPADVVTGAAPIRSDSARRGAA